jgi:F0F1-type ATP synthase membrane subunit a
MEKNVLVSGFLRLLTIGLRLRLLLGNLIASETVLCLILSGLSGLKERHSQQRGPS